MSLLATAIWKKVFEESSCNDIILREATPIPVNYAQFQMQDPALDLKGSS